MNLVVVEDHPCVYDAIRQACRGRPDWRIAAETASGLEGVELIKRLQPDLVLLDLMLPDLCGLDVAERVRAAVPHVKILLFSGHLSEYVMHEVDRIGVQGFIHKRESHIAMLRVALVNLEQGHTYFCERFRRAHLAMNCDPRAWEKLLSDTEHRIVTLLVGGLDDERIGRELDIAVATAKTHHYHILHKLDCHSTRELIVLGQSKGYGLAQQRTAWCELF